MIFDSDIKIHRPDEAPRYDIEDKKMRKSDLTSSSFLLTDCQPLAIMGSGSPDRRGCSICA